MSDAPTPSPVPPPPPPPPPADLVAAGDGTGAAAWTPAATLKRVGGIGRAAMILVSLSAAAGLGGSLAARAEVTSAEDFLAGSIDEDAFIESMRLYVTLTAVQAMFLLASAVVVVIWMYRIAANHRALHRAGTWGPGWAIGGWLLPPALHVIPFLMFRELWRASNPDATESTWRAGPISRVVSVWFVLYGVLPLVFTVSQGTGTFTELGSSTRSLAEEIADLGAIDLVAALVNVAGAAAFVVMALGLTARHRRLTGEAAR